MTGVCEFHHCNKIAEYRYKIKNKYGVSTDVAYCGEHAESHAEEGSGHYGRTVIDDE